MTMRHLAPFLSLDQMQDSSRCHATILNLKWPNFTRADQRNHSEPRTSGTSEKPKTGGSRKPHSRSAETSTPATRTVNGFAVTTSAELTALIHYLNTKRARKRFAITTRPMSRPATSFGTTQEWSVQTSTPGSVHSDQLGVSPKLSNLAA